MLKTMMGKSIAAKLGLASKFSSARSDLSFDGKSDKSDISKNNTKTDNFSLLKLMHNAFASANLAFKQTESIADDFQS